MLRHFEYIVTPTLGIHCGCQATNILESINQRNPTFIVELEVKTIPAKYDRIVPRIGASKYILV